MTKRHASWLELFYDLLFVALFVQLAHELATDPSLATTVKVVGLFAPAWWAWVSHTVSSNVFGEEGPAHRLLVLVTMACLLVMISGVPDALDGEPALYAAGYAAGRLALLTAAAAWHVGMPESEPPRASYALYTFSALLWIVSIPLGPPVAYLLWAVSVGTELVVRVRERARVSGRDGGMDADLLVERFGLLVIVALGEGVVQIATALADVDRDATVVATGVAAFAILAALWWTYFDFADDKAWAVDRADGDTVALTRDVFVFGHFVLLGAVLATSAGLGEIVRGDRLDLALLGDALVVHTIASVAIAIRLGAPPRHLLVSAVPVVAILGALARFGEDLTPPLALAIVFAALGAGHLGHRRP